MKGVYKLIVSGIDGNGYKEMNDWWNGPPD